MYAMMATGSWIEAWNPDLAWFGVAKWDGECPSERGVFEPKLGWEESQEWKSGSRRE